MQAKGAIIIKNLIIIGLRLLNFFWVNARVRETTNRN